MAVIFSKSPNENLKIVFSWATELAIDSGTTIASVSYTITPSGLTTVTSSVSTNTSTLVLSGGTSNIVYSGKAAMTTNTGRVYEQGFIVNVQASAEQPTNCYASVADVASSLGFTSESDVQYAAQLVQFASRWIDEYCGRKFYYEEDIVEKAYPIDKKFMLLERSPLVAVTSITLDGETIDPADYLVFDESYSALWNKTVWQRNITYDGLWYEVTYDAGYKLPGQSGRNLPFDLEYVASLISKSVYFARDRDPQVAKMAIPQVISLEFSNAMSGSFGRSNQQSQEFFNGLSMLKKYKRLSV